MKNIFVNDIAAKSGGALTVLNEFVNSIARYDQENHYYVFCNGESVKDPLMNNIHIIENAHCHGWFGRLLWDDYGISRWAKKHQVRPDLVLSLQNTGVKLGRRIKQIIYYHQSIPFYEYPWSPFRRSERILWLYQNIYPFFVTRHLYKKNLLVVQANWIKAASSTVFHIPDDQIAVIRPLPRQENPIAAAQSKYQDRKDVFRIIYPASAEIFKNHKTILSAMELIRKQYPELYPSIRLYLTIEEKLFGSPDNDNIEYLGYVNYEDLLKMYQRMDLLVFPSYMETVGLPLLEAAFYGIPVIASDLPYARDVIGQYEGAVFAAYDEPEHWASEIIKAYHARKRYESFQTGHGDPWKELIELIQTQLTK